MVETTFEKVSDIFYSVNIHLYNLFYLPVSEKLGEIIPTFCGNFPGCICIYASVCNTQGALPWWRFNNDRGVQYLSPKRSWMPLIYLIDF